jgi:starvation-inducible DNA-binding protein
MSARQATGRKAREHNTKDTGMGRRLNGFLADTYVLLAQTQGCHWNATGANFYGLHKLTEAHYGELFAAIDTLAERVRALGVLAPSGLGQMLEAATLEDGEPAEDTGQAVRLLVASHVAVAERARDLADDAEEADDLATHDMLVQRIAAHDKAAWLLRSHLA